MDAPGATEQPVTPDDTQSHSEASPAQRPVDDRNSSTQHEDDAKETADEEDSDDEDGEGDDDDEEPHLKYAYLTKHLRSVYRNGDATSTFLSTGDKMVCYLELSGDSRLSTV